MLIDKFLNRCKALSFALLITGLMLYLPQTCFSQSAPKQQPSTIRLAGMEPWNVPLKEIVTNPTLVSTKPGCTVTSFEISFLPKGGDLFGPFKTTGAAIKENQVNYLREFTNTTMRIFIEDIHMNCNGKDITEPSILVVSKS